MEFATSVIISDVTHYSLSSDFLDLVNSIGFVFAIISAVIIFLLASYLVIQIFKH